MSKYCPECHRERVGWNAPYQLVLEVTLNLPEQVFGNCKWNYGPFNRDWNPNDSLPVEILNQFKGTGRHETKDIGCQRIIKMSYDNHVAWFRLVRFLAGFHRIPQKHEFARYVIWQDITQPANKELSDLVASFKQNEGKMVSASEFFNRAAWNPHSFPTQSVSCGEKVLQCDPSRKIFFYQMNIGGILHTRFELSSALGGGTKFATVMSAPLLESENLPEQVAMLIATYRAATAYDSAQQQASP